MPTNSWILFARKVARLEEVYTPTVRRIIREFRRQFIQDLESGGTSYARSNLSQRAMDEQIAKTLMAIYRTAGLMGAKLQYAEMARYLKETEKKAANFGRNEEWIQQVIAYLRFHSLSFVTSITETMRGDILKILDKGLEEGLSIQDMITSLRSVGLVQARARVIARTEIIRAANVGHAVSARSLPFEVDKKWSAARDERTRPGHRDVHGRIVEEDGTFRVPIYRKKVIIGYDEMQYPGDATASAANVCNCRCRITHVPKRAANGKLIMRDQNQARIIPMRPVTSYTPSQIAAILKENVSVGIKK
jgi:uncharacterized protein with gpF-like domain